MKKFLTSLFLVALTAVSLAAAGDLSYPPSSSGGHDFNHAPIGQSFTAPASDVHGGIYLADETSFTLWLSTLYPNQIAPGSYPYAVAPSITVRIDLLEGEGTGGPLLHSTTRILTAPFMDFVDVDYGADGVVLTVGQKYTMLLTDVSGQVYPQGVTGWVVPSVVDWTAVYANLPAGAYPDGQPILQGAVVGNDAGIGDNSFQVVANAPREQIVSGVNAVITAYVARNPGFIVINGGLELLDHLWTTNLNPGNTTFLGGLVNWFQTGLLVDYTGIVTSQGVLLTQLTVKPAPAPLVISISSLPAGTVGVAYAAPIPVSGGLAPLNVTVSGLPPGLGFDGAVVSGVPAVAGVTTLAITVTDALGRSVTANPTLTINPAPTTNYTVQDEGKGKISSVGAGWILVGTRKIVWNSSTSITVNTPGGTRSVIDAFVKPGMKIQWKGLRDRSTGVVLAIKLEIN